MTTIYTILGIFFVLCGCAKSQYQTMYMGTNSPNLAYDKTRQEIIHNFLNNKPLLNYVPVYNTDYSNWENKEDKDEQNPIKKFQVENPELDFEKFGEVITRLKTNMQNLSHKTKHIYEDKLKELGEVKKLYDNLKVALQNTDALKKNLHQNQKKLAELSKNPNGFNGFSSPNSVGVDHFLKSIEGLESMVRNINYKYDGKPRM